ncbi:hypothetical protein [Faecalibaculum rodentium]|uniref:hypothetical protein n=1 Tax=Faecalibaculum rodentium TaxID=1702221 RepID=UPI0026707880|nr:hypothetical protein [Faecalibaculum rodentium]
MEQKELNIYDQNFKAVMQIAPLSAYILKCLHPEFYKWPLETIVDSIHRDSSRTITLRNTEFSFNGHIMHADSLGSADLPIEDTDTFSRYLIHFEMQLEDTPGYDLERRQLTYAHGLLDTFKTSRLYDETPQIISIWLHPYMSTTIDKKPEIVIGSGNMDVLPSFFEDEEGWYNETNQKRMRNSANKPIATVLWLEFGVPPENATHLQKVLYNVFLLPADERDYEYLESQGIYLNTAEREAIDMMQKENNIFYTQGVKKGKEEGMAEGEKKILQMLQNTNPAAYKEVMAKLNANHGA